MCQPKVISTIIDINLYIASLVLYSTSFSGTTDNIQFDLFEIPVNSSGKNVQLHIELNFYFVFFGFYMFNGSVST